MAPMGGRQVTSGRGRTDGAATRAMRRCRNHSRRHARARTRPGALGAPARRCRRAHAPPRTAAQTLRRYPFRGGGAARHVACPLSRVNADRPTPVRARNDRGHSVAHTRVRGRRCIPRTGVSRFRAGPPPPARPAPAGGWRRAAEDCARRPIRRRPSEPFFFTRSPGTAQISYP